MNKHISLALLLCMTLSQGLFASDNKEAKASSSVTAFSPELIGEGDLALLSQKLLGDNFGGMSQELAKKGFGDKPFDINALKTVTEELDAISDEHYVRTTSLLNMEGPDRFLLLKQYAYATALLLASLQRSHQLETQVLKLTADTKQATAKPAQSASNPTNALASSPNMVGGSGGSPKEPHERPRKSSLAPFIAPPLIL